MKICLLGDHSGSPDEGMKNIVTCLQEQLSCRQNVITLNPRRVFQPGFWRQLCAFHPDLVHYIPGPSIFSFLIVRIIEAALPDSNTIMSAPLPLLPGWTASLLPFLKPELMLAQSETMQVFFERLGIHSRLLPISGVDCEKFLPALPTRKTELRRKLGIPPSQFVVLHVGHIKRKRNVQWLASLREAGILPMLIGSTSTKTDERLRKELIASGCMVITDYLEHVEEYYQASDCYVFPIPPRNTSACIEIPLSILEALACNLPILTTPFGGLPDFLRGIDGVTFADGDAEMIQEILRIVNAPLGKPYRLREVGQKYSWQNIAASLDRVYGELAGVGRKEPPASDWKENRRDVGSIQ